MPDCTRLPLVHEVRGMSRDDQMGNLNFRSLPFRGQTTSPCEACFRMRTIELLVIVGLGVDEYHPASRQPSDDENLQQLVFLCQHILSHAEDG